MAQSPNEAHYRLIADRILDGAVVPFLGAGVNLCGRPDSMKFELGHYLPSGSELASYLARHVKYPYQDRDDLLRVSQYVDVMLGLRPLYEELHDIFDADYEPTPVHRLLASIPALIRGRPSDEPKIFPLIVTTNYDVALERAFTDAGEEYDLVTYIADGPKSGRFLHTSPDGVPHVIRRPNTYTELGFGERPVIAKIHGTVTRGKQNGDSFVITENHYIDYLSRTDIAQLIPVHIAERMRQTHFLFLGYSLKDWNLRVILHRIFRDAPWGWNSWAVQLMPESIEEKSWFRRGVELLDARLEEYVDRLSAALVISASAPTSEMI
jgi:SIR2-like domain